MFDPFGITQSNRRIQRRAQILRPKGTFEAPQEVITPKVMDQYASILKANNYTLVSPFPFTITTLFGGSLSVYTTQFIQGTGSEVNFPANNWLVVVEIGALTYSLSIIYLSTSQSQKMDEDEYYILFPASFSPAPIQVVVNTADSSFTDIVYAFIIYVQQSDTLYTVNLPFNLFYFPFSSTK